MTDDAPTLGFAKDRVNTVLERLEAMVAGDEQQQVSLSSLNDELDAIAFGINALADELRWANARVTDAERRLAADLRISRDRAERANESKTIFLRTASHEIRTPIAAILGIADLLAIGGLSPEDQSDLVDRLRANSRMLLSLVGNVLDLSRLDADKFALNLEAVSPLELVREIVDGLGTDARKRGLHVGVDFEGLSSLVIETDRLRLRQILMNVIANALKFTPSGRVDIDARTSVDGKQLTIDVTDTGIGIATHQIPNLFEPFGQLDSSIAGLTGGTGLGLALSQRLAEQLGGTLSLLHSEPGKGSTFRLMLEIRCVERTATVSSTGRRAVSKRPPKPMLDGVRVLLADDNSDLRMAIGRALRLEGAVMSYASNGREALEMAQSGEHEVVLMDVKMPLMSGLDATRALRAAGYQLPIVALSADSTTESRTASIAAGCSAYLTKPFDPGDLIASIRGVRSATTTS